MNLGNAKKGVNTNIINPQTSNLVDLRHLTGHQQCVTSIMIDGIY